MNKKSKKMLLSSAAVLSTAVIMGVAIAQQQTVHADTTSPVSQQTRAAVSEHDYVFIAHNLTLKQSEVAELMTDEGNNTKTAKLIKAGEVEFKDTKDPDNTFMVGVRDWGGLTDKVGTYQLTLCVSGIMIGTGIPTNTTKMTVKVVPDTYVFSANDLTLKQSEAAELLTDEGDNTKTTKLIKASKAEYKETTDPENYFQVGVKDFGGLTDEVGTYKVTFCVVGIKNGTEIPKATKTITVKVVPDSDDNAKPAPAVKYQKVYRLYNKNTGEHLYTESSYERDNLIKTGWTNEGTGWSAPNKGTAVYRVYNPNAKGGDHYYTASKYEATNLVKGGWKWDNSGKPIFYSGGKTPVYVAYNPNAQSGSHSYTTSSYEQKSLLNNGWKYGKIQFYGK